MTERRQRLVRNVFFGIGLLAFVVMLFTFNVSFAELWQYICRASYWLAAIVAVWVVLYMLNALTWRTIILGGGTCLVHVLRLYQLTITGYALNYSTPFGLPGGEAYKVIELSRYIGTSRATSSTVLYAMMHVYTHFWFWLTGVAIYILLVVTGHLSLPTLPLVLAFVFIVVLASAGIYFFLKGYKNGMLVWLFRMLGHIPGLRRWVNAFYEKKKDTIAKADSQIAELHNQDHRSFVKSFFLEYGARLFQSTEIFFMLLLFGIDGGGTFAGYLLTWVHAFLILDFTSVLGNLLGFIPMQLGGREGGFALSSSLFGLSGGTAMFISIISRLRELFWIFTGLVLMRLFVSKNNETK